MPRRTRRADEEAAAPMGDTPKPEDDQQTPAIDSQAESNESALRSRRRHKAVPRIGPFSLFGSDPDTSTEQKATPLLSRLRIGGRRTPPPTPVIIDDVVANPVDSIAVPAPPVADVETPPATEAGAPSGRRRSGGRRPQSASGKAATGAQEIGGQVSPVEEGQPVEPVEPSSETQSAKPGRRISRRGVGGRRGSVGREAQPATDGSVTVIDGANASTVDKEDQDAADEGSGDDRRQRRSRRGGRRRGGKGEADAESDALTETHAPKPDEFDLTVPQYEPAPVWRAPRLAPTAEELGLEPVSLRSDSRLDAAAAMFVLNGQPVDPHMLFVNTEEASDPAAVASQISLAAATGIHVFSAVTYLPLKNAYGERSYGRTDDVLKQILQADPDARVLLRLQCVPTNYWARVHPGELAKYSNGSDGDVSFASTEFWGASIGAIAALIAHLADPETFGGDRVIGLHLDKGEWFHDSQSGYDFSAPNRRAFQQWLHEKYQNIYALRAAWHDGSVDFDSADIPPWISSATISKQVEPALYTGMKDRRYVDYHAYASDIVADAIVGLAEAIKWLSGGKLLVGASYGYTFEFAHRNESGHQSLYKVLASDAMDLLAGPNSYQNRTAGGTGAFCSAADSVRLHGKVWLVEDDTKTHMANEETEDTYNPKIASPQDTLSVHRRNALTATVHQAGVNWMDLWGHGWLNDETIWRDIDQNRMQHQAAVRLRTRVGTSTPEVVVIVDEASYSYVRADTAGLALQAGLITKVRDLLYRSGASVGFYLQSDLPILPADAKVYIFLNALRVTTTERHAIRERLQVSGKTLVWLYGPGLFDEKGQSRQEVAEIVGQALKPQPWNSRVGTLFTEERHPIIERLHGGKRMGSEEIINPSYTSSDPQGAVLGEYIQTGAPSIVARNMPGGWRSVFVGDPHLTGELVRGIFRYAGVHVFDLQDDIVAAGNGCLLVHAPYTGQRTLHLPKQAAVYSLTENRLVSPQASSFRYFMRGRSTHFFLYGSLDDLSAALELSVHDLRASHQVHRDRPEQDSSNGQSGESDSGEMAERVERNESELDFEPQDVVQIIGGMEMPDNVDELPSEDEALGKLDTAAQPEPGAAATPSRRRRWNRRRQKSNRSENTTPVSIDELLGDLTQRKQNPPPEA